MSPADSRAKIAQLQHAGRKIKSVSEKRFASLAEWGLALDSLIEAGQVDGFTNQDLGDALSRRIGEVVVIGKKV